MRIDNFDEAQYLGELAGLNVSISDCKFSEWRNLPGHDYKLVLLCDVVYYLTTEADKAQFRNKFSRQCEILYFYSYYNPTPHKTSHDKIKEQVGCF